MKVKLLEELVKLPGIQTNMNSFGKVSLNTMSLMDLQEQCASIKMEISQVIWVTG